MKIFIVDVVFVELLSQETSHAFPLAEYHHLAVSALKYVAHDVHCLVNLHVVACLLVENVGAVAHHAHHIEVEQQSVSIFLRKEVVGVPFVNELSHSRCALFVNGHLLIRHRHEQISVASVGQLHFHIAFSATNQLLLHLGANGVEVAVAQHLPCIVGHNALVAELIVWTEAILIHQFHHREQFFKFIFKWCA